MRCSIIIPVLNEAEAIVSFLSHLQKFRKLGHEVIVVDGGSIDDTCELARPFVDVLLQSPSGRAKQMNTGAETADGELLIFLHADTVLPDSAIDKVMQELEVSNKL